MLEIKNPALPIAPILVQDDDGSGHDKELHVEMAEDDLFFQFQSKFEELEQKGGQLPAPWTREKSEERSTAETSWSFQKSRIQDQKWSS